MRFTACRDGQLLDSEAQVFADAGHDAFRREAFQTLSRAGRLPPFPENVRRRELLVEAPMSFLCSFRRPWATMTRIWSSGCRQTFSDTALVAVPRKCWQLSCVKTLAPNPIGTRDNPGVVRPVSARAIPVHNVCGRGPHHTPASRKGPTSCAMVDPPGSSTAF